VNLVADVSIGDRNDGGFDDRGMFLQGVFYFRWRDEYAAAFEAVVAPAGNEKIAFVILLRDVAGKIPALSNHRFGSFTILVITEKQPRIRS
jgi:hypothetical protein